MRVGYFSGFISTLFPFLMILSAYFLSLEYNPLLQTISKLGIQPIGQYSFIIGIIVGGMSFSIYQHLYFDKIDDQNAIYGRLSGIIAGIGMVGVGIFPDYNNFMFEISHFISAFIFFTSIAISILFYGKYLNTIGESNSWDVNLYKSRKIVFALAIFHGILSIFKGSTTLFGIEFGISIILQKITTLSFFIWHIVLLLTNNSLNRIKQESDFSD